MASSASIYPKNQTSQNSLTKRSKTSKIFSTQDLEKLSITPLQTIYSLHNLQLRFRVESAVRFLRVEPNLNHDPNDPSSVEWNILGEVEFSSQNLTWSHTGSGGTGTEGILLPFDLDVDADNTTVGNYPDLSNVDRHVQRILALYQQ